MYGPQRDLWQKIQNTGSLDALLSDSCTRPKHAGLPHVIWSAACFQFVLASKGDFAGQIWEDSVSLSEAGSTSRHTFGFLNAFDCVLRS